LRFEDFSTNWPTLQRGTFVSLTDAGGNTLSVTSRTADGKPAEVQWSTTAGTDTYTESVLYTFLTSGVNAGMVSNVTLRGTVNSGAWTTVRQGDYTYYGSGESHGPAVHLKTVEVKDAAGNLLDKRYYRYYNGEAGGNSGNLKYAFGPESFARLAAAFADPF